GILAGQVSILVAKVASQATNTLGEEAWGKSMNMLITLVLLCGLLALPLFRYLNAVALKDPRFVAQEPVIEKKEQPETEKTKFSMRENFRILAKSKYILCLALIIIAYNIIINLTEVLWKQEVYELHHDP